MTLRADGPRSRAFAASDARRQDWNTAACVVFWHHLDNLVNDRALQELLRGWSANHFDVPLEECIGGPAERGARTERAAIAMFRLRALLAPTRDRPNDLRAIAPWAAAVAKGADSEALIEVAATVLSEHLDAHAECGPEPLLGLPMVTIRVPASWPMGDVNAVFESLSIQRAALLRESRRRPSGTAARAATRNVQREIRRLAEALPTRRRAGRRRRAEEDLLEAALNVFRQSGDAPSRGSAAKSMALSFGQWLERHLGVRYGRRSLEQLVVRASRPTPRP